MTFDKFTIKAQEAVQAAVNTAQRNGQQTIEPVHLLSGIMRKKGHDVTNFIFQKLGSKRRTNRNVDSTRNCSIFHAYRVADSHTSPMTPIRY